MSRVKATHESEESEGQATFEEANYNLADIAFNEKCRQHDAATPIERVNALWCAVLLEGMPRPAPNARFNVSLPICKFLGVEEDWLERKVSEYLAGEGLGRKYNIHTENGAKPNAA